MVNQLLKIMIIDGGMGTELNDSGTDEVNMHQLWSAIVNIKYPERVISAHQKFINAGADIIITNSYKTNVPNYLTALGTGNPTRSD